MKFQSALLFTAPCLLLALLPSLAVSQDPQPKPEQKPVQTPPLPLPGKITGKTMIAFNELKWTPIANLEGAQQAPLWGETDKGAHRVMYMWPAGTKMEEHSHTNGDRGVVVMGTLTLVVEGAEKRLPQGSFFSLAGGTKHTMANDASEPCFFYVEREGAYDVVPVK
ncbi:MAG TPA: DUF4437 domain-containing protein [Planctomycetota bacterium]|nr:DUF4437 domain-containing protein [Planctomycetota bacterium]